MERYRIQCGGLTLTAKQEKAGWSSMIDGYGEHHLIPAFDEAAAKNACVEGGKGILTRLGFPVPECLTDPRWDPI